MVSLLALWLLLVGCGNESGDDLEGKEENASSESTTEASQPITVSASNLIRLTNMGTAVYPDLSPDGKKIAFASAQSDSGNLGQDIYVINADGTGLTNLTNSPASDSYPNWSPDGKKIAFAASTRNLAGGGIYVVNADGTNSISLTNKEAPASSPVFSPDGSKIAFVSPDGIYVVNADGTDLTLTRPGGITGNQSLTWTPDGSKIVFHARTDSPSRPYPEIYSISADGTDQTRLTNNQLIEGRHSLSPDGTKIAFESNLSTTNVNNDIYIMNADGTDLTNLTDSPAVHDVTPTFTPDGKIAFTSNPEWDDEIYLMNPDGTDPINLTNRDSAHDYTPTFSADGKKMAFVSRWPDEERRPPWKIEIYVADIVENRADERVAT